LDCGCIQTKFPDHSRLETATGYATFNDKRICYACADNLQREEIRQGGKIVLYWSTELETPEFRLPNWKSAYQTDWNGIPLGKITTWSGGNMGTVCRITVGQCSFGGRVRYYLQVRMFDGTEWHGSSPGGGMYCRMKKKKIKRVTMNQINRGRKQSARERFGGSNRLFAACWRDLLKFERESDFIGGDIELDAVLNEFASRRVNNSRSSFWIYGE
jgi:hypothetical protein